MGDFYQNGLVTTLHNLGNISAEGLEKKLEANKEKRPMALIIPSLFSELQTPALSHIVDELQKVNYLNEVVIGIDRASESQFKEALKYFSRLPQYHRLLWNDGPGLKKLQKLLCEAGFPDVQKGKGQNAWFCLGYLLASGKSDAIALHDADIVTYSKSMLTRLLYPIVEPKFNFRFCKGYYFRSDQEKLNGRVARLLVIPLIRTLKKFFPDIDYLDYLDSFRYPLSGEFSLRADVVKSIRIPSDWGLEVAILSEIRRDNAYSRICQVDIADQYDHKHQDVSFDDPKIGLSRMSRDISETIFRKLASNGISFTIETVRAIKATYLRIAEDFIDRYYADAIFNGFTYYRHKEEQMVNLFSQNIYAAGEDFLLNPHHYSFIPTWQRILSAYPEFPRLFLEAVEEDNA